MTGWSLPQNLGHESMVHHRGQLTLRCEHQGHSKYRFIDLAIRFRASRRIAGSARPEEIPEKTKTFWNVYDQRGFDVHQRSSIPRLHDTTHKPLSPQSGLVLEVRTMWTRLLNIFGDIWSHSFAHPAAWCAPRLPRSPKIPLLSPLS